MAKRIFDWASPDKGSGSFLTLAEPGDGGGGGSAAALVVREADVVVPVTATHNAPMALATHPVTAGRLYRVDVLASVLQLGVVENLYLTLTGPASVGGQFNVPPPASLGAGGLGGTAGAPTVLNFDPTDEPTADGILTLLAWLDADGAGAPAPDPATISHLTVVVEDLA